MGKRFAISFVFIALLVSACAAYGEETVTTPAAKFDPAKTVIAVLPTVNDLGKQDKEAAALLSIGREACKQEFSSRGFQIVGFDVVDKIIADQKIDFTDEENRTKATLQKIGQAANANIVCMVVLQPTKDTIQSTVWASRKLKQAYIDMRVLDVATGSYLTNGVFIGKAGGSYLFGALSKSSPLRHRAVAAGVNESLKELLKPYKAIKTDKGSGDTQK